MHSIIALMYLVSTVFAALPSEDRFSGTFEFADEGFRILLVIRKSDGEKYTGDLSEGDGDSFRLEATLKDKELTGSIWDGEERMPMRATLEDDSLTLTLMELDENGVIDQESTEVLQFKRMTKDIKGPKSDDKKPPPGKNPLAKPSEDPYSGTLEGDGVKLTLEFEGTQYKGTLNFKGQQYPVVAKKESEGIKGSFTIGSDEYPFSVRPDGEVYSLQSGGAIYRLMSDTVRPSNPLADKNPLSESRTEGELDLDDTIALVPGFKQYRHALGMSFQHPADWKIQEVAGGLTLSPPNVRVGAYGPEEVYFIVASPSQGIEKSDDPRLSEYLDQSISNVAPYLRRTGPPAPFVVRGIRASLYTWEGQSPLGFVARAENRVAIAKGFAAGILAVGPKDQIAFRQETLGKIFQTFAVGKPQTDPALIGTWYKKNHGRVSSLNGTLGSINTQVMVLLPDGRLSQESQTMFNAETQNQGGGRSSYFGDSGSDSKGIWGISDRRLTLLWPNGSYATYQVHVQGTPGAREMLLTPSFGGEKELWTERND